MPEARILIVEDESIVAMDIQARLESQGYTVAGIVATGPAAIQMAREGKVDIVLMDIMIDGEMDGIQAAMAIRKQLQIPIIYLSAYADAETLNRAKLAEPFGFIHKPLDPSELHSAIEVALFKNRMDIKLRDSEKKYRSMMEAMSDMVYICSADYRIEFMNPAMIRKIGRDATGELCHRALYQQDAVCSWCAVAGLGPDQSAHWEIATAADQRTHHVSNVPIINTDGLVSRMSMVTDITERKQAAKAVQESETRYKRLVKSLTDYIYTVKVENERAVSTVHGPACVAVTGYSLEEYQADPDLWFKMVHEEDRVQVLNQAQRLLSGQTIQPLEHRIIHKSNRILWVRNTPVPHYDETGRLTSYDGLVSNITERKLAEEQLKEHARKLGIINRVISAVNKAENQTALLDLVLDASLELIQFRYGGIYLVQEHAATAELACSKVASSDFTVKLRQVSLAESPHRAVLVEGEPLFSNQDGTPVPEFQTKWNVRSVVRVPLICKDSIIGAMLLINPLPYPFTSEEKGLLQSIGRQLGTAISKMRSEAALRESEDKYRMISEQSLTGIQIINDGCLIFVNDGWSKIVDYTREEAQSWGRDEFQKIIHPDDRDFFMDQTRKKESSITEGIVPIYDCRFLSRSGTVKWVLIHSKPVLFTNGLAIVSVVMDITDRKLAEQALAESYLQLKLGEDRLKTANQELSAANREKEILLKEIHHRVKNNLQVISSLLKLQVSHVKDATAAAMIRECQNRIRSIAIVHEKLYQSPNLANIDFGEYIRSLISHLFRTFLVATDAIRMHVAADNVSLDIDKAIPCCLIINELVTNSLKYAFPRNQGGEIGVHLKADDSPSRFVLVVSDNGVGFPKDLDFRNTSSLGMQLVITFVEQMGGTISLDTHQGTSFTIQFAGDKK
ncbi:MAG: PAS domain S-box protein [Verrucomicrobia bacterium]|nr:PAS domain S-box protein [Verrucomicrobiota bacterium]MBU4290355.1 PAS domain S-box protein [Verrucomicrobiota bacterium]MBU4430199.1 PAS domain S-box protein [Verrucomicrobiota bacterium]MCG2681485.1 PAS domain S-box protein [Kiritimatiellia bacterium]